MTTDLPHSRDSHELRSARLLGSDHTTLGAVEIAAVNPCVAVGISCGRFPKGYPHVDPNEDAVFAATDGTTTILAVADGHRGSQASHAAITAVGNNAVELGAAPLDDIVGALTRHAIDAVRAATPPHRPPPDASATAITVVGIRAGRVSATTLGDTACFVASRCRVSRVGRSTPFLSAAASEDAVEVVGTSLPSRAAVIVASDGFLSFTQSTNRELRSVRKLQAADAVAQLIAAAFAGGAGDNVAVAVFNSSP